jgi:hypothetical protein
VAKSEQASELHRLQVHFRVTSEAFDPIGHALMITDYPGRRFCTILPQDPLLGQALYFQVEIDRIGGDFIRFAAYLSSREQGPARLAAAAWDTFRAVGASDAAKLISKARVLAQMEEISRRGKEALAEKFASPVGATAGAVLLLKANRLDLMHDWTRNLANWFPWLPDGVVFWTEQCHREGHGSFRDDVIPWFVRELSARSLPFTCDGLGLAANLLSDIERERIAADPLTRSAAAHVKERVDAAMFYFRDDGLFCTYAGMPEDWVPAAVLGPPAVPAGSPPSNETTSAPDQRDLTR